MSTALTTTRPAKVRVAHSGGLSFPWNLTGYDPVTGARTHDVWLFRRYEQAVGQIPAFITHTSRHGVRWPWSPPERLISGEKIVVPPPLPMPGHRFHTFDRVVASVWLDDEGERPTALLLLLTAPAPFYRVADVTHTGMGWVIDYETSHHNIVPAVHEYESRGGDY